LRPVVDICRQADAAYALRRAMTALRVRRWCKPPSATRTEPVTNAEASLARKTIAGASCSTVP
jgi:hypothetical protein